MKKRDSYDHVEIYPRNFAPEKPESLKQINDLVISSFAENKKKVMRSMNNLVNKNYYILSIFLNVNT